jgi:hypothetical protein
MKNHAEPLLLGFPEAQRLLGGLSRSELKILANKGEVATIKIGRRRMFLVSSLKEFIAAKLQENNTPR